MPETLLKPMDLNFAKKDGSAFLVRKITVAPGGDYSGLQRVPVKYQNGDLPLDSRHIILPDVDFQ